MASKKDEFMKATKTESEVAHERASIDAARERQRRQRTVETRSEVHRVLKEIGERLTMTQRAKVSWNTMMEFTISGNGSTLIHRDTDDGKTLFKVDDRLIVAMAVDKETGLLRVVDGSGVQSWSDHKNGESRGRVGNLEDLVYTIVMDWCGTQGLLNQP